MNVGQIDRRINNKFTWIKKPITGYHLYDKTNLTIYCKCFKFGNRYFIINFDVYTDKSEVKN